MSGKARTPKRRGGGGMCSSRPAIVRAENPTTVDHIQELFKTIDLDNNGELDLDEFRLACLLAIDDEEEIKRVFESLDNDGSGNIDMDEFSEGFYFLQQQIADTRSSEEKLKEDHIQMSSTIKDLSADLEDRVAKLDGAREETQQVERAHAATRDALRQREEQLGEAITQGKEATAHADTQLALKEEAEMQLKAETSAKDALQARLDTIMAKRNNIGEMDDRDALFAMLDVDDGGSLSFDEFRLACLLMTSDAEQVREVYNKIDTDGSGEVDLEEFKEGFDYFQSSLHSLKSQKSALESEKKAAEEAGAELAQDLTEAKDAQATLEATLANEQATGAEKMAALTAMTEASDQELATLKAEKDMVEASKTRLLEQLTECKSENEVKDKIIADMKKALEEAAAAELMAETKADALKSQMGGSTSTTPSAVADSSGGDALPSLAPAPDYVAKKISKAEIIANDAVTKLQAGIEVMKYNYKNNDKAMRWLFLSKDKKKLCWGKTNGKSSSTVPLKDIRGAVFGPNSDNLKNHPSLGAERWNCFSFETSDRSLDFASAHDRESFHAFVAIQHLKLTAADPSKVLVRPGVVLWQIARMRVEGEAERSNVPSSKVLTNVLTRATENDPDNGETPRSVSEEA